MFVLPGDSFASAIYPGCCPRPKIPSAHVPYICNIMVAFRAPPLVCVCVLRGRGEKRQRNDEKGVSWRGERPINTKYEYLIVTFSIHT